MLRRLIARVGTAVSTSAGLPLYALSGLFPRRADHVVFGGNGDRFADNAKHQFLHMAADPAFRCTWITGDRTVRDRVRGLGLRAEMRWSPGGARTALRAGWFVYGAYPSDINFLLSRRARLLNLWHGVPLKAIEFDVDVGPLARVYRSPAWSPVRLAFLDRFVRPDLVVSPSRFLTERCFSSAFRIPPERCLEVGYPRTDLLFDPSAGPRAAARLGLGGRIEGVRDVIGYFPTWREDGRDFLADAGFSFEELDRRLAAANRFLLFKAHPNFGGVVAPGRTWERIEVLEPSADLSEVLPACDVLVTDYSSVAFDFLLLDRPIIHFLPDHERYVGGRNLYFDLAEMTAGPVVRTPAALYGIVAGEIVDEHRASRSALRRLVWGAYGGGARRALAEVIATAS